MQLMYLKHVVLVSTIMYILSSQAQVCETGRITEVQALAESVVPKYLYTHPAEGMEWNRVAKMPNFKMNVWTQTGIKGNANIR